MSASRPSWVDSGASASHEDEQERVERALREVLRGSLRAMPAHLREPVEYALASGGKRLRPVLCVLAYRAVRGSREPRAALYRLSCALEIVHTYSLLHDDLPCMDDDDLRRGRPTVHRVFGEPRATLAGAALLPLAVELLAEEAGALGLGVSERGRLIVELCRAAGATGMVAGQLLDLGAERREVDAGALEEIHRRKTGELLTCSLRIGALAAGADAALLEALTAYGRALGLAFQIADDVLDVAGDPAALGKSSGRDEALRKASYAAMYGLESARVMARERVEEAKSALGSRALPELRALADFVIERRK